MSRDCSVSAKTAMVWVSFLLIGGTAGRAQAESIGERAGPTETAAGDVDGSGSGSGAGFSIDSDYPGGNIRVRRMGPGEAFVEPDLRDTQAGQWWFYWSFRLRGPAERPIRVYFTGINPIGMRGPAFSADGGSTWRWVGAEGVKAETIEGERAWSFEGVIPRGSSECLYAFCPSYDQRHLDGWLESKGQASNRWLRVEELCRSRKGRKVEMLRVGATSAGAGTEAEAGAGPDRGVVLLTSRHHCCEVMATYAMEGFLEAVLGQDELGRRWRESYEVVAIPFMDKDGVEEGDQGKNRAPHDHNRDYNEKPVYPEVAAVMKLGEGMREEVRAAIDLHCPHIRGEWNDRVYLVGAPEERTWEGQKAFGAVLERVKEGPIPFTAEKCLLPHGQGWNTAANLVQGQSFGGWARGAFPKARLTTTIEIAYADAQGVEVNAASARALGRDIARALLEYLGSTSE